MRSFFLLFLLMLFCDGELWNANKDVWSRTYSPALASKEIDVGVRSHLIVDS
jgi:hypothetical protein